MTTYLLNDAEYWDRYVIEWDRNPETRNLHCIGREWGGDEIFVETVRDLARRDETALEIGCGGGRITEQVHEYFKQVIAADVSEQMLTRCRDFLAGRNLHFAKIDGFTLEPLADRQLDFIYSHDVFVHFSSLQVYSYLREIYRTLAPGGRGVLSFYNFSVHFDLFRDMSLSFQRNHVFPPHMRVHFVTEEMIRFMLAEIGFEVVKFDTRNFLVAAFQRPES